MQRNADVVRRWLWAFDKDSAAFRDTLHREIEWFPFEESHTLCHGVEDAMRVRRQWLDTWDEHRVEVEEVIVEGGNAIASVHVTARGKVSGVEVNVRLHPHYKLRDAKVVYVFEHQDRAAALQAAGIAE